MREVAFVRTNADKWKRYEKIVEDPSQGTPDELADLFVELTDDLSYARTFYPDGKTVRYLNALTASVHRNLYKNKKENAGRIKRFWWYEHPLKVHEHRRELLITTAIFAVAILIGILSTANDDSFARLILGDRYVNMTIANVNEGDPMAVYKQQSETSMFLGITVNNMMVALRAFAFGFLASIGTAYILFFNGVMIGTFFTLLYAQGVIREGMETVWIHGTLEIASILIAGCAGLVIGNNMLFPGTFTRKDSIKRGARDGLKIVMGTLPFFLVAGFLEGFVTRHTNMPVALSYTIIGGSLAFLFWYYHFHPRNLIAKGRHE